MFEDLCLRAELLWFVLMMVQEGVVESGVVLAVSGINLKTKMEN
jgi:hypothetical protein